MVRAEHMQSRVDMMIIVKKHAVLACPILQREMPKRIWKMLARPRSNMWKEAEVKLDKEHWCKHVPKQ